MEPARAEQRGESPDALLLQIRAGDSVRDTVVLGQARAAGEPVHLNIDGKDFELSYGSKLHSLPFALELLDFDAQKYPGTQTGYSGFKSRVLVRDPDRTFEADIFMNHVLDHGGFRFYQASFHADEKGTILSVNHDAAGTLITYTGYFLLYLGLLGVLFSRHTRFARVVRQLNAHAASRAGVLGLTLTLSGALGAQQSPDPTHPEIQARLDSIVDYYAPPPDHTSRFAGLVVQDPDGRMKPMDSYASEILRKLSKREVYRNLTADQVVHSMLQLPEIWFNVPLIYLGKDSRPLRNLLGISVPLDRVPLVAFFRGDGGYKIEAEVKTAHRARIPSQFQKDLIAVDGRVHLLHAILSGRAMRLFPLPGHDMNLWISTAELGEKAQTLTAPDSTFIAQALPIYFDACSTAARTGDYTEATTILRHLERFQRHHGAEVIPNPLKIRTEMLYNRLNLFKNLVQAYLFGGLLLLALAIRGIFRASRPLRLGIRLLMAVLWLCYAIHTAGLGLRWYIAGHAPWSDAYETMIYIAWATMLFGIYLGRKSALAMASTAFVVSVILMVAHWNWLDPAVANLQPVLNSYWLMIHVAIIVASYGPFTVAMILCLLVLAGMVFLNRRNRTSLSAPLRQLLLLAELAMTMGLVMLTIGNFLGGQWANESWGRYWAWDPKETWALVSILVYALIIHMRLVPGLRGRWVFAMMGVVGYSAILMTYFGVNFYLSGLHAYASGEQLVTPSVVFYAIGVVGILGVVSYVKAHRHHV